jgi:hypothetical protein
MDCRLALEFTLASLEDVQKAVTEAVSEFKIFLRANLKERTKKLNDDLRISFV